MSNPSKEQNSEEETGDQIQQIKVPAFMETAVPGWFTILNAQFALSRITKNKTKFQHTLVALPPDTIDKLDSSVLESEDFSQLKNAVSRLYESSKSELFDRLISKAHTRVTGKPSLFLAELRAIASKVGVGDEIVRHKFLQSVDQAAAAVLAAQKDCPLSQLGQLADDILPFIRKSEAYMVRGDDQTPPTRTASPHHHQTSTSDATYPSRGVQPFSEGQRPKVCRAHLYFGTAARTCRPWCQWPNKPANLKISPNSRPSSRSSSPVRQSQPQPEN